MSKYKIDNFQNIPLAKKMVSLLDIPLGGDQFRDAVIGIENTEIVNKKLEFNFLCFTIPSGLITALLNMRVLMMLWKKEKTVVNQLMMIDCIMNILFSFLYTFRQSPYFRGLDVEVYCYFHLLLAFCCFEFNRLCPVAIAVFR
jgi:hypothetical protein